MEDTRNIKISIFGTSGVGKTTYFLTLYHALNNIPGVSQFYSVDDKAKKYYSAHLARFENSKSIEEFFKQTAGTLNNTNISGILERENQADVFLELFDYAGEWASSDNFDKIKNDNVAKLRKALFESDAIICFVDTENAFDERNNLLKQSSIDSLLNFFRNLLKASEKEHIDIPIGIFFNKIDILIGKLEENNSAGLKTRLESSASKFIQYINKYCINNELFFLSSVEYYERYFAKNGGLLHKSLQNDRNLGIFQTYDPTGPIVWIVKQITISRLKEEHQSLLEKKEEINKKTEKLTFKTINKISVLEFKKDTSKTLEVIKNKLSTASSVLTTDTSKAEILTMEAKSKISELDIKLNGLFKYVKKYDSIYKNVLSDNAENIKRSSEYIVHINSHVNLAENELTKSRNIILDRKNQLQDISTRVENNYGKNKLDDLKTSKKDILSIFNTIANEYTNAAKLIEQKQKESSINFKKVALFAIPILILIYLLSSFLFREKPLPPPPPVSCSLGYKAEVIGDVVNVRTEPKYNKYSPDKNALKDNNGKKIQVFKSQKVTICDYSDYDDKTRSCNSDEEKGKWCKIKFVNNGKQETGWVWGWCLAPINE